MALLAARELKPFDRLYANVTADIEAEAAKLTKPDSDWLLVLVAAFQRERQQWNIRGELVTYRIRWARFRSKLLRLVAGAYLHIGYDLPRALADDWPGLGTWSGGPSKPAGQGIYFRLGSIFPNNLLRSGRSVRIIGLPALIARRLSDRALGSAAVWVDALRKGAWLHAEILAFAPDRARKEAAMATALTAALEDASGLYPWSILRLLPPDSALYASGWASFVSAVTILAEWSGRSIGLALLISYLTSEIIHGRFRISSASDFISTWGFLTNDYVASAIREPEGFAAYRERRRGELGIRIAADAGTSRSS